MKEGFGYNGEEQDGNGLFYQRVRYYYPELGRFISKAKKRCRASALVSKLVQKNQILVDREFK